MAGQVAIDEVSAVLVTRGDYPVTMTQPIHEQTLAGVVVGGDVVVKIDPDDPQSLLVWGAAS